MRRAHASGLPELLAGALRHLKVVADRGQDLLSVLPELRFGKMAPGGISVVAKLANSRMIS
jgi:hypothetical protein